MATVEGNDLVGENAIDEGNDLVRETATAVDKDLMLNLTMKCKSIIFYF